MTLPHWEDYWRTGWVVSCPTGPMSGYTGEVRATWERWFATIPDGARLLDVGTGNGALPLIALDVARARGVRFEIHGVDLAEIDPQRVVPDGERLLADVVFHPGVEAGALPFPDGHFAAACGQYALEYTDRRRTLRELRRVLVAAGRAQFILHHAASIVARNARESLGHMRELEQAGAFSRLRDYVAAERGERDRLPSLYAELTASMQRVHAQLAGASNPQTLLDVLQALARLFELRGRLPAREFDAALDDTYRAFKAAERRLEDLVTAALDEDGARQLVDLVRESGFDEPECVPLLQDGGTLVGWRLAMRAA